jgi:hypothetical protein
LWTIGYSLLRGGELPRREVDAKGMNFELLYAAEEPHPSIRRRRRQLAFRSNEALVIPRHRHERNCDRPPSVKSATPNAVASCPPN